VGLAAHLEIMTTQYKILVGKTQEKRKLEGPKRRRRAIVQYQYVLEK